MQYRCVPCGWIYDEEKEGTKFDNLPPDFICPACGASKEAFEKVES